MSSAPPSPRAIRALYAATLRCSRSFTSYNFREYFVRRTRESFHALKAENDPAKVQAFYSGAVGDLAMLRRCAVVNQMYGGQKLAVEAQETAPEPFNTRGDT